MRPKVTAQKNTPPHFIEMIQTLLFYYIRLSKGDLDQPPDFESVAYLSQAEYSRLLAHSPASRTLLENSKKELRGDVFFGCRHPAL